MGGTDIPGSTITCRRVGRAEERERSVYFAADGTWDSAAGACRHSDDARSRSAAWDRSVVVATAAVAVAACTAAAALACRTRALGQQMNVPCPCRSSLGPVATSSVEEASRAAVAAGTWAACETTSVVV